MSKTTPGPWVLRTFGHRPYVMDSIPDDERCVGNIIATPNTNPDWDANARLIASAPDMLAACKAAQDLLQRCDVERMRKDQKPATNEELDAVVKQLWAVIQTAEGGVAP